MSCASCGRENRPAARFCSGCGQPLLPRCARCGAENARDAQFCDACGAALAARAPAEASARKVVTVVFADLVGSVSLHERLDAESARRFIARYHEAMSAAVHGQGGTVVQLLGDGVLAAFGVPRVAEDDALRSVRAAVAMQSAFRELLREQAALVGAVGLRVAVNTGEVVVSDDQTSVIGDPTNVAARLQQEARDGDVLIGEATQRLVSERVTLAPLGSFALRGRAGPVSAWRVVSLDAPAGAPGTAFVGREEELRRLRAVFDAAVAGPGARLAVLLGSPGLGKSRLLAEFARRLGERATVLAARCDAARGRTFAPLAAALRAHLGLGDAAGAEATRAAVDAAVSGSGAERARIGAGIAALLGGAPASPEETFFVVRRLFAGFCEKQPVVLVFDDVQWAEPLLLDLAEHLVQWSSGVPLLVLLGSRPELRELRSALATPSGVVFDVVTLSGLDAGSAMRLAANAVGAEELPAALLGRVLAASEGNPLFVGELVRMLVHDGVLRREGERWITAVELARLEMPPTIHALLAARIERLGAEERALLERAAVVGRHFSRAAVAELLGRDPSQLDAQLESLRRSELIEPDNGWFLGEPALRFHHALIRDAAYRRVLRRTRAELHARLAEWISARAGGAAEHDEAIGWHLEQAHEHLRELGPLDAQGARLGARAASHLGAAGRRALARDDLRLAADLLGRALACLDPADPARAELALDWCEALLSAGEVAAGTRALAELGRFAGGSERLRAWHACFAGELAVLADPQALHATAQAVAAAAGALAAAGDLAGEAKAHSVHATALARLGQIGASEAALERALAAARAAHDRRRANAVLAGAPIAQLFGPSPVARASGRCLDVVRVLRITQGAPAVEAVALRCQAVLEGLRGRADAARRMIAAARKTVEELGITAQLLEVEFFAGYIELLEGDPEAAARCLSAAYEGLREHGLNIDAARAAALLARTRLAQGDAIGAEVLSHESESLAGDDLNAAISWRGARAEALARRGEHTAAIEFARAAVEIASATDALLHHANARLALATALRGAGRAAEADAEEARALELWEAKGATLLVERARQRAERTAPRAAAAPDAHAPAAGRAVRPNFATRADARIQAAFAARDLAWVAAHFASDFVGWHRPTGAVIDRSAPLDEFAELVRARGASLAMEPLASLGDELCLFRRERRFRALDEGERGEVGPMASDDLLLIEADARELVRRAEIFADDRLGDAIARLYQLHAARLARGPERARAEGAARAVTAMLSSLALESLTEAFAPSIEVIDHRNLGTWVASGVDEALRQLRGLHELADAVDVREVELLGLRADALLTRRTYRGNQRAGGGSYERQFLMLLELGSDGRISRLEQFDDEREAEALAHFDARTGAPVRRVVQNRATANSAALAVATESGDRAALEALLAPNLEVVDHSTGAVYGRAAQLERFGAAIGGSKGLINRSEPLATLGDALAVCRIDAGAPEVVGPAISLGPFASARVVVCEVDAEGRRARSEHFGPDRLGEAIARLYARYAERLPEGRDRIRAEGIARSISALSGPADPERWAPAFAPELEFVDLRGVGPGSLRGAAEVLRSIAALFELSSDLSLSVDDVYALREDALVVRRAQTGTQLAGGGTFERVFCALFAFGPDGRLVRWEQHDPERVDEALAHFDALGGRTATSGHAPENAATRQRRVDAIMAAGDAEFDPGGLLRFAADGRIARAEHLDPERRAQGLARFANAASRALERTVQAWRARDWNSVAASFAPDHVMDDRRALFRMRLEGAEFFANEKLLFEVNASEWQSELVATRGERLALSRVRFSAQAQGGGPMAVEMLDLIEVDAQGRRAALVVFDPDDVDAAYEALDDRFAAGEAAPLARAWERQRAAWRARAARDWSALEPFYAPDIVTEDHRPAVLGTLRSRDELMSWFRSLVELAADAAVRIEHVLGFAERRVLHVVRVSGTREGGRFETVLVVLQEKGADGVTRRDELYDPDQLDLARARYAELGERPEHAPLARSAQCVDAFVAAIAARDRGALSRVLAPELVVRDHRPVGWQTLSGPPIHLETLQSLFELAPDLALRGDGRDLSESAALLQNAWVGAGDGGAFEAPRAVVFAIDRQGRIRELDLYAADQLELARARFAAASLAGAGDPLARFAKRNAATAALDRAQVAFEARDLPALRALCASGAEVDGWLSEMSRGALARDGRRERTPIATGGDLVALERVRSADDEHLLLAEVDDAGRFAAALRFEPGERRAALREAWSRWLARDAAAAAVLTPALALLEAINDLDRARIRASLADDFVVHDRRRARLGLIEGPDAYVDSVAVVGELAPSFQVESPVVLALEPHGVVSVVRTYGALEHGGVFEGFHVAVSIVRAGRITRMEFFELEESDAALARFAELRPARLHVPPNRATAVDTRLGQATVAQDWTAVRELVSADFRFEDRRKHSLVAGDIELYLRNLEFALPLGAIRRTREILAAPGERLSLGLFSHVGAPDGGEVEGSFLRLVEIDAQDQVCAVIHFDLNDRHAASLELLERAARCGPVCPEANWRFATGLNGRDIERLRSALADGFVLCDHRRTGVGRISGADAFVASLTPLFESSRDFTAEIVCDLAADAHGALSVCRGRGTLVGGGEFESLFLRVTHFADGLAVSTDVFELDDLERARARFAELRARPPDAPNAAARSAERVWQVVSDEDWDALRAMTHPDLEFDDRRRRSLVRGGVDVYIRNLQFVRSARRSLARELLATAGDRLSLQRVRYSGGPPGQEFLGEFLLLTEIDGDGRRRAVLHFDPDDLAAAQAELSRRAGGAG